jgi:AcrR family transcriptional regulator
VADQRIEKGQATRERLVTAARGLFASQGYEATSVDAVLKAAGVARGSLYHHFPTKEALFDAVLDQVVAEVAAEVGKRARRQSDPLESLRAGCRTWLQMALDPGVQRIAIVDAPAVVGWARWRELDEQHTLGGVRKSLRAIAEQGRLPAGQVDLMAHMVLAAVNEAALLIARADDPPAALRTGRRAVDTLLDRLVSPPS